MDGLRLEGDGSHASEGLGESVVIIPRVVRRCRDAEIADLLEEDRAHLDSVFHAAPLVEAFRVLRPLEEGLGQLHESHGGCRSRRQVIEEGAERAGEMTLSLGHKGGEPADLLPAATLRPEARPSRTASQAA
jgi:hypothetical protein